MGLLLYSSEWDYLYLQWKTNPLLALDITMSLKLRITEARKKSGRKACVFFLDNYFL